MPTKRATPVSLPRILEPEPASPAHEANHYYSINLEQTNHRFVNELISAGPVGPRVIDLGCGPCGIAIELCTQKNDLEVLAIDLEVAMLEIAKREIDIAGLLEEITLHHADASVMEDYESETVDTIISNSLFHHLAEPESCLAAAHRLVKPNGRVFIRDLFRPESESEIESLLKIHVDGESDATKQLFRQSFLAALTLDEIREISGGFGIPAEHVQMTSDRHWTIDWRKPA